MSKRSFEEILQQYCAVNTHQGTDKNTSHSYGPLYSSLFAHLWNPTALLEIGIDGGAALLAYAETFPTAHIYGMDIEDNLLSSVKTHPRITTWIGDAKSKAMIDCVPCQVDVLIEDASHLLEDQIQHFKDFSKYVKPGGLYIIEDVAEVNKDILERVLKEEANRANFTMTVYDLRPVKQRFDDIVFVFQKTTQPAWRVNRFVSAAEKLTGEQRVFVFAALEFLFASSPISHYCSKQVLRQCLTTPTSQESLFYFTSLYEREETALFCDLFLYPLFLNLPFPTTWGFPLEAYQKTPRPIVPEGFSRVSLDVGMAFNGPNTSVWVKDPSMFVLGFEPNPTNLRTLHLPFDQVTPPPNYPYDKPAYWLDSKYIGTQVQIFPLALSNEVGTADFYCTTNDPGTSSLYKPLRFGLEAKISVPKTTLSSILFWFPWDRIPYIDHLKIDAQGHDFEILLGAVSYLERVAFLNVEMSAENQYEGVPNKFPQIDALLQSLGFAAYRIEGGNCSYFNTKLQSYCSTFQPQFIDM